MKQTMNLSLSRRAERKTPSFSPKCYFSLTIPQRSPLFPWQLMPRE